jgi:hypothetical protein
MTVKAKEPLVADVKCQCPACGHSSSVYVCTIRRPLRKPGTLPDGTPYSIIRYHRRRCRKCETVFRRKIYENL